MNRHRVLVLNTPLVNATFSAHCMQLQALGMYTDPQRQNIRYRYLKLKRMNVVSTSSVEAILQTL